MRLQYFQALIVSALLNPGLGVAASPQASTIPVRESLVKTTENSQLVTYERCTSRYPAMREAFAAATASHLRRYTAILDELLKTEQFNSLAKENLSQFLADTLERSSASKRNVSYAPPEEWCKGQVSAYQEATDEQLRDMISTQLVDTREVIDSELYTKRLLEISGESIRSGYAR